MTAIRGMAEIVLAAHDQERMLAFYQGNLGSAIPRGMR